MANISIKELSNHFFLKTNKKRENNNNNNNNNSNIVPYDFFSVNETQISEKIAKIPYYFNYYIIISEYNFIEIGEINDKLLKMKDDTIYNQNGKYLLFQYKYKNNIDDFDDFLLKMKTPVVLIQNLLDSFSYLLMSFIKLNDNNLCFFNLSAENIVFIDNCREKPILQNFNRSLQISKLNECYISKILTKITNYTHKPIEIHLLFYLIQNNWETITPNLVEQICDNYINNLSVLSLFSQNYINNFKKDCINFLNKFINIPKNIIIANILEYNDKWDIYSLSLLYLHIIGNIARFFSLKETFMNKFTILLCKNIHPDPLKRESLHDTKELFENIFTECTDWSFIKQKQVTREKWIKLMELL